MQENEHSGIYRNVVTDDLYQKIAWWVKIGYF